jgi:hypothetical protein
MKGTGKFGSGWVLFVTIAVPASLLLAFSTRADAQSQGNNAVYNSSGSCSPSCGFSGAFIDASTFFNSPPTKNFCSVLNWVLNPLNGIIPSAGAVIDARGLPGTTGTSMKCTASPWAGITTPTPATILLPAGTILIPKSWILPANTHLIGEGDNPSSAALSSGTTLQACRQSINNCSFADTAMIQFGSSSTNGISVENVTLDGQGQFINGIVNQYSSYLTHVDRVMLFQILGTGRVAHSSRSLA